MSRSFEAGLEGGEPPDGSEGAVRGCVELWGSVVYMVPGPGAISHSPHTSPTFTTFKSHAEEIHTITAGSFCQNWSEGHTFVTLFNGQITMAVLNCFQQHWLYRFVHKVTAFEQFSFLSFYPCPFFFSADLHVCFKNKILNEVFRLCVVSQSSYDEPSVFAVKWASLLCPPEVSYMYRYACCFRCDCISLFFFWAYISVFGQEVGALFESYFRGASVSEHKTENIAACGCQIKSDLVLYIQS